MTWECAPQADFLGVLTIGVTTPVKVGYDGSALSLVIMVPSTPISKSHVYKLGSEFFVCLTFYKGI